MRIRRLRDRLLLGAAAISIVLGLAYMSAVSWVISRQYLAQSNDLLLKASRVIEDSLAERKNGLAAASRQLATQKNLGSTVWYLTQYARSNLDRETLFNTYQQLVRETHKTGRVAKASRIAIYDSSGDLIAFALLDDDGARAGFVERFPRPSFEVAALKNGEEFNRKAMRSTDSVAGIGFTFDGPLPQRESVHYAVVDGLLSVESHLPIVGEAFNPTTGKPETRQLGLVAMVQPLDESFVRQLSRLTDTDINVFTSRGFSSGSVMGYRSPDWKGGGPPEAGGVALNEITIDGAAYYQGLIPLYADRAAVGAIATLHSKAIVQKNTWEMIRVLWLIAGASLVLIFPLVWYFATTISHPLAVLGRIFRGVAGDRRAALPGDELRLLDKEKNRPDELGDLTQSFIAMAAAVEQKVRQINEINASLEHTVEERTAALRAREQELSEANAIKDKFFTIIAHDLRGPICGLATLFDNSLSPADLSEETLELVRSTTRNTRDFLEELLTWARSQRGEIACNPEAVDLCLLLHQIQELLSTQAHAKGIHLDLSIAERCWVRADPAMTRSVLRNLVQNALKFTGSGGSVRAALARDGGQCRVTIADTGVGMSAQMLNDLFRLDAKLQSSPGTCGELGTGLGLILCKEFVERNGGAIGADSELGRGSAFWFSLPVVDASAASPAETCGSAADYGDDPAASAA